MAQMKKREDIKLLLDTNRFSPRQIAQQLDVGVATVYNVRARCNKNVGLCHSKGAGRSNTLRKSICRSIIQKIRRKPYLSLRTLAKNASPQVSHETVRRALSSLDYTKRYPSKCPMLSEKNRLTRLSWAKKFKYPKKAWARTVFCDEMSIWLSRGKVKCGQKVTKK